MKAILIIIAVIIIGKSFEVYLDKSMKQSESYKSMMLFLSSNDIIPMRVGYIKDISVVGHRYSIVTSGHNFGQTNGGCAKYTVYVIGEKSSGNVFFDLVMIDGVWEVIRVNFFQNIGDPVEIYNDGRGKDRMSECEFVPG